MRRILPVVALALLVSSSSTPGARAADATARVAVVDMDTQVSGRDLRGHDPQRVRAAVEAVSRIAGADVVLEKAAVTVIAPARVPDLSRAVAQRLGGTTPSAVPRPDAPARLCVLDSDRTGDSRLGRPSSERHVEDTARGRGCDLVLTAQVAIPLMELVDLAGEAEPLAEPTMVAVVDVRRLAESALGRTWAAAAAGGDVDDKVWRELREFLSTSSSDVIAADVAVRSRSVLFAGTHLDATAAVLAAMDNEAARAAAWAVAEARTEAVRAGGQKEPQKLKDVRPVYPEIARQARVQGTVVLECLIDPQGRVSDVRVVRGIPLLDSAAIEAVRQWSYAPSLLNGVPVPVILTVTVDFSLR